VAAVVEIVGEEVKWGWRFQDKQPRRGRDWQERKIIRGRRVMVCLLAYLKCSEGYDHQAKEYVEGLKVQTVAGYE
jgi:hypothetical protein